MQAIIFDLDGTLVDSYPGLWQSLNETLRALDLPEVDLFTLKRRVGKGLENLISQSVPAEMVSNGIALFRKSYERTHLSGTFLFPEVKDTLDRLKEKNVKMAVASNKPADFSNSILVHLQIDSYFLACVGPNGSIQPKPHPSMLKACCKALDAHPWQCLYVGDMLLDAETAANAGVHLALIASGAFTYEELQAARPHFLLRTFSDLKTLFSA